jgi:hypothetical protein
MKKISLFMWIIALLSPFVSVSAWEGRAGTARNGELPETGYYIAVMPNSFPLKTIVEVTNLENGRSVRAEVYAWLNNPVRPAILSKDTAGEIRLDSSTVNRIRIDQLPDSAAYSQFSGRRYDPDFDPAAFAELNSFDPYYLENGGFARAGSAETWRFEGGEPIMDLPGYQEKPIGGLASTNPEESAKTFPVEIPIVPSEPPEPVISPAEPRPEFALAPTETYPVEIPLASSEPLEPVTNPEEPRPELALAPTKTYPREIAVTSSEPSEPVTSPAEPRPELALAPTKTYPVETVEIAVTPSEPPEPVISPAEPRPELALAPMKTYPGDIPFAPADLTEETPLVLPPEQPQVAEAPKPVTEPADSRPALTLVPAETRPPERISGPDEAYIIPSITPPPSAPPSGNLAPPHFVDPAASQVIPAREPPLSVPPPAPSLAVFSVPIISSLEKGSYYLQIAAYGKAETVQSEISKLDRNLPLAVMSAGSAEKPLYRILIGPVNLGESGALLQRFRFSYKDAFVRLGT